MHIHWSQVGFRFVTGGAFVALFSLAGEIVGPKRLAGVFGGAPSVATASLLLTLVAQGSRPIPALMTGMLVGAVAFVAYTVAVIALVRFVGRLRPTPS